MTLMLTVEKWSFWSDSDNHYNYFSTEICDLKKKVTFEEIAIWEISMSL